MDGIEQRIAHLSPAKRKLLAARLGGAVVAPADPNPRDPIPPDVTAKSELPGAEVPDAAPRSGGGSSAGIASIAQRRLWFMQKFVGESAVYHNAHAIRFRGPVDPALLHASLQQVIARHQALRMHFSEPDGFHSALSAVVTDAIAMDMPVVDLSGFAESERKTKCDRLIIEFGRQPFNLATGPLLRMTLLRLAADEHLLIIIVHHIVSDRWSVGILLGELAALYSAAAPAMLPALTTSYIDCAAWEQARQREPAMARHLAYWRELLADRPPPLDFPADHARPAFPTYAGAVHACDIPAELVEAVSRKGRLDGATPFMVFAAAFNILVARSSAADDVIVGMPLAGRHTVEAERLIGLFVNILPLRMRVDLGESFAQLLARVKPAVLGLLAHQEMPFDRLVEELRIERDHSRHPLFEIVFNFHNVPYSPKWPAGLHVDLEEINLGTARFDLMLTMRPAQDGSLRCEFEYSRDLFEPATIERLGRRFQALLRAIADDTGQPVGLLPLLDDAERRLILHEWSSPPSRAAAPVHCAHEMFEHQAALTPQADALRFADERLTYRELDQRANRLAWKLRALGAAPEKLVAICLRRTAQLPIALLAILKSGAGYVPLDPAYPKLRLEQMLEDSRASILLTERLLADLLPAAPQRTVLKVDDDAADIERQSHESPPPLAGLSNLAYVIFTSGSTGRPKGVAIEHGGAAALVQWARAALPADQIAGMLFSTSVCFDLSVFELLVPLCCGGKIILVQNALELPQCPARDEVTFINTVPSAMTELASIGGIPASVRAIGLGGEPLPAALARRCYESPGVVAVYNIYGPTEDTVYSTAGLVPRDCDVPPSIGRPIGGTRTYILDARMQPVPIGINGELYLGGSKLAHEYLHRQDLTAERFIPNPLGAAGERLYRTGDLCRWNADGTIQFLGRIDHQIKLRGFRIELGEIEASLGRHPGVRQCLVIVAGEAADRRLVAYVVGAGPSALSVEELREFVASQLPAYMIPANFVFLGAMPMTPNGKIDRRALPPPGAPHASPSSSFVAPHGPVQSQLAEIWREVLGVQRIGATDNFFDLGGHSLMAVRLMHQVERRLGCTLPLARLFTAPTIAHLAELIASTKAACESALAVRDNLVPFRVGTGRPPLFCVSGAGGHAFGFDSLARLLSREQPFYALQYEPARVRSFTPHRVEEMAANFIAQIRRVRNDGPYAIAGYSFGGVIAYEMARQLAHDGLKVGLLALFDSFAPGTLQPRPFHHRMMLHARRFASLGLRGAAAYVRERLRGFNLLATSGSTSVAPVAGRTAKVWDLVQTIRQARSASVRCHRRFRPQPYLDKVTLFRSSIRSEWQEFFFEQPTNGWEKISPAVEVRSIPGTHLNMFREPNVSVVARELNDCLSRIEPR